MILQIVMMIGCPQAATCIDNTKLTIHRYFRTPIRAPRKKGLLRHSFDPTRTAWPTHHDLSDVTNNA